MEDSNDPVSGNSLQKKKSKKKKKKNGGKPEQESQEQSKADQEKQPQQATDRDETIIRTTKCSYCGKNVRQLLRGFKNPESVSPGPVVCEMCLRTISQQKDEYSRGVAYVEKEKGTNSSGNSSSNGSNSSSSSSSGGSGLRAATRKLKENLCNCVACVSKRENTVTPDVERDAHITQSYWMEIRHIVRCIYREDMSLSAVTTRDNIGSDKMRGIVRKLCCRDPHQFFQRLETLAREYLLEVKVRLLEQLSCGFNSPQLAIEFIQMLLDEYSSLCAALPALLYLLEPLEETEYIRKLGVTIELVNKNIFRELIFAESFMSSNLPLIIAQLRLASLSSDPFHRSTADALSQRYNNLDDEMDVIGNVWNTAKDQLKQQQEESKRREERRAHIEKILSDGELFIKKHSKKENQHAHQRNEEYTTTPVQASSGKIREEITDNIPLVQHSCNVSNHKLPLATLTQSLTPPNKTTTTTSNTPSSSTTSVVPANNQSSPSRSPPPPPHPTDETPPKDEEGWLSKEQVAEWSKILFKCIKPIGDPEFRITDSIATHTITLKIDMTAIDLRHAESVCTHEQVKKYEELGMRREEIAEVALKLNAIKHLGINLRIDDLFDEHGFVIVEGNDYHEDREDAVYFVEEGKNSVRGKEKLMEEEMNRSGLVNLQHEKEKVICREKNEVGEGRETDLLQSMTMKIRFMKSVADEDMRTRLMSDSEQVMFESCDQVQMKLTQLELNTMRLMCTNKCLATNLGIRKHMKKKKEKGKDDEERFVHTDANQPFVGLLLEQGKQAEQLKKEKEEKTTSKIARDATKETKPPPAPEEKKDSEKVVAKVPEQVSSSGRESSGLIRPAAGVCIPSQSNSCQCFACIGAVAAQITEGSIRPLNPVDPSGSKLSIKGAMSAKLHTTNGDNDKEQLSTDEHQHSNKSVSNKAENLWHNWMSSTTHDTPSEDVTPATPPLKLDDHPSEPTTTPEQPSTPVTSDHTTSSSSSSSSGPLSAGTTSSSPPSTACICSDGGTCSTDSTTTTATTATSVTTISTSNPSTSSSTSNGTNTGTVCSNEEHHNHSGNASHKNTGNCPVKRYCPCCYCELFGQNTPTVPTSHNYHKQRDKMRQKLEKKRKQEHVYCHHRHHHDEQRSNSPVDVHQENQHHHHHHHHHTPHPQPTPSPPPPSSSPLHPTAVTTGTVVTSDSSSSTVTTTVTATSATTNTSNSRNSTNNAASNNTSQQQKKERSLDEILKFIEGKDFNESSSLVSTSKSKKKKKGKKKTEPETTPPLTNGHIVHPTSATTISNINTTRGRGGGGTTDIVTVTNSNTTDAIKKGGSRKEDSKQCGTGNSTSQLNGGLHHQQKKGTASSHGQVSSQNAHKPSARVNSPKQPHKKSTRAPSSAVGQSNGLTKPAPGRPDNQLLPDSNSFSDLDEDYDREIEEFKKLCLNSAPVESRKKIHVSLNMQDIRSKVK